VNAILDLVAGITEDTASTDRLHVLDLLREHSAEAAEAIDRILPLQASHAVVAMFAAHVLIATTLRAAEAGGVTKADLDRLISAIAAVATDTVTDFWPGQQTPRH
jgi:hypothetical protein